MLDETAHELLPRRQPRLKTQKFLEPFLDSSYIHKASMHMKTGSVHVAVLVRRGQILGIATNRLGTRSRGCGFSDYTIHAEVNVIRQVGNLSEIKGADLFVVRIPRPKTPRDADNESFLYSKPCHSCSCFLNKCMREYGLRNVYYS